MKTITLFLFSILLASTASGFAQNLKTVKSEIKEAALKEQNAFKNGDCAQVLALMDDDITFLANGKRVPSKEVVGKFCNSILRPFKTPTLDRLDVYPLTKDTGYTIKTLEYPNDETTKMKEFVTKIWKKTNGTWRISHLHSTVKKVHTAEN